MSDDPAPEPDLDHVVELRRRSLERAGYEPEAAAALAARLDIPLQDALAPRKAGLPFDVALAILTSGDRPVF